jgi:hypothetical protein
MRYLIAAVALAMLAGATASSQAQQPTIVAEPDAPRAPGADYSARGLPDRIVLTPGADPARAISVSFRTDVRQASAVAELAQGVAGPSPEALARTIAGVSAPISTANGEAIYHQVRFENLTPDTPYVYRVRGAEGWSEWFAFRTAAADARAFRFIYVGDMQNSILDRGSRVIRQALLNAPRAALVLHAGDLVAQRDDMVHDDEWGEWNAAGGFAYAMTLQAPAPGNHEYLDALTASGEETRVLGPHWPLQFALPDNGAPGVERTSYYFDYQGVRFVIADVTAALDLGALDSQTAWLDRTLAEAGDRWTIVLMHQPMLTCHREENTEPVSSRWRPIFEARGVDLVVQGHDHCYGRWSDPPDPPGAQPLRRPSPRTLNGPVYVVSVAGSKMYTLNARVRLQADRWGEDTQLYQVVDIDGDRLRFAAYTAVGELYDGFDLVRRRDGRNRLIERPSPSQPRVCEAGLGPDRAPCSARD